MAILNKMSQSNIKGAQFPGPPDINLEISNSFDEFIVEYDEKKGIILPDSKILMIFFKLQKLYNY